MKDLFRRFLPHIIAIVSFVVVSAIYFYPVFDGHSLRQGDITNFRGMAQEIIAFRQMFGEEPLWTNSMFSGMPAFQISVIYPNNIVKMLDGLVSLGLPRPANYLFLYMFGFYLLLISFRVKPAIAGIGALAFAFSSYFIIILEAGHNSKAHAIAYMAPALAGIVWAYRGRILFGGAVAALFLALQLAANHVQITYYFGFLVLFYAIAKGVEAFRKGTVPVFLKASAVLVVAGIVALGCNLNNIWNTYEYGKYTTRGATELTIKPDGSSNADNATAGLDRDYVTQWSYGIGESFSFLIPNAKGGSSGLIGQDPERLKNVDRAMQQNVAQSNQYWGDQPFTSGPVYMGALVILLFLLGAFFVKGPIKWALIATAVLTTALGWGKNFMGLTDFFLDVVPGYDKFRAVTIILAVTELVVPLLGFLFLKRLYDDRNLIQENQKAFLGIAGVLAGLLILFLALPDTFFDFVSAGERDQFGAAMGGENASQIMLYIEGLKSARISMFRADTLRSLAFVVLGAATIWLFAKQKLKEPVFLIVLGVLVLADLWSVDKRFLDNSKERGRYESWEPKNEVASAYKMTAADKFILDNETAINPRVKDGVEARVTEFRNNKKSQKGVRVSEDEINDVRFAALRFNTDYRVLELGNPFNDGRVAYFHKSIGGYHGAKLKRYQELIEFHIQREMGAIVNTMQNAPTQESINARLQGSEVLNMLNTKYLIYNRETGPIINRAAHGSAWFVEEIVMAEDADDEITKLGEISTRYEAVVDKRFADQVSGFSYQESADAAIAVEEHLPNYIKYIYDSDVPQAVVFSEIYYDKGWKAYLDGAELPYFRANYVLRGMIVPEGSHTIEFKFAPETYATASTISTAMGLLLVLLFAFAAYKNFKVKDVEED
jgi:hypothetical protein